MGDSSLKHALKGDNHESIGTRIGLYIDPLHWLMKAFGGKKNSQKYDAFVNKSGDFLNKQASSVVKPVDKVARRYDPLHKAITSTEGGDKAATWIANKPATTAGIIYGGIAGGSALAGGGSAAGTSAGSAAGSTAGATGTAGVGGAGLGGVGGAGAVGEAALPEIVVTGTTGGSGGAALGAGGAAAGAGAEGSSGNGNNSWQKFARQGGMNNQQQQQPTVYEGRSAELERQRQELERIELEKRRAYAQAMRDAGMYSPA